MSSYFAAKDNHIELKIANQSGVKAFADESGAKIIGGLGAVYFDGTPGTEYKYWGVTFRLKPGCLDAAVAEDDVRSFFNHDENWLLGRTAAGTMRLFSDPKGIRYETVLNDDDSQARDVYAKVSRGDCTGSSMMFVITDSEMEVENKDTIEWVTGIKPLMEMGPVVFPAMTSATSVALDARSHAEFMRRRESQQRELADAARKRRERILSITGK